MENRDQAVNLYRFSKVVKEIVHYFLIIKNSKTIAIPPAVIEGNAKAYRDPFPLGLPSHKLSLLLFSRIGIIEQEFIYLA